MFLLHKPTADDIHRLGQQQSEESFSYAEIGLTRSRVSRAGYQVNRHSVEIGTGEHVYRAARLAISQWKMFPSPLTQIYWPSVPMEVGRIIIVGVRVGFIWTLNPCRIVFTVDDESKNAGLDLVRFGFAYGTLPGHVARGEERFLVKWDRSSDRVTYEILCCSRPQHLAAKIGLPYVHYQQRRFRTLSGRAMQSAVDVLCSTSSFVDAGSISHATSMRHTLARLPKQPKRVSVTSGQRAVIT